MTQERKKLLLELAGKNGTPMNILNLDRIGIFAILRTEVGKSDFCPTNKL